MNLEEIKEFIRLAKNEGVTELEYKEKDKKLSVSFNSGSQQVVYQAPAASNMASNDSLKTVPLSEDIFHTIKSPFVGTFYRSPSPEEDSFVKVGDRVDKGQTLCILEAMKIMNDIESDIAGEIVEICVENESLVEYGQVLFKIRA